MTWEMNSSVYPVIKNTQRARVSSETCREQQRSESIRAEGKRRERRPDQDPCSALPLLIRTKALAQIKQINEKQEKHFHLKSAHTQTSTHLLFLQSANYYQHISTLQQRTAVSDVYINTIYLNYYSFLSWMRMFWLPTDKWLILKIHNTL